MSEYPISIHIARYIIIDAYKNYVMVGYFTAQYP